MVRMQSVVPLLLTTVVLGVICPLATAQTCEPVAGGSDCSDVVCPTRGQRCQPRCVRYNPANGATEITQCECGDPEFCHAVIQPGTTSACIVPNDMTGTVHLPPQGCQYTSPTGDPMQIIDGLPLGATIDCAPTHFNFVCSPGNPVCSFVVPPCHAPGGSLGGEKSCVNSTLNLVMNGTGGLLGYNRNINLPVGIEIHAAPRIPFTQIQSFDTVMYRLFGQIIGDPDFDLLRIVGGTDFGLPSPGHTRLVQLPGGSWAVDSFFDITYRIDFVGAPGGPLAGRSGSTTGTIRLATGQMPTCATGCVPGFSCDPTIIVNPDGSIDICCECNSIPCEPEPDGSACKQAYCAFSSPCQPRCVDYFPTTGQSLVRSCECDLESDCFVDVSTATSCLVPNDGTGTAHLPPQPCAYKPPPGQYMHIIDGLFLGDTIQCDPTNANFLCSPAIAVCSFATPPCYGPGSTLLGEKSCANSNLNLIMAGTGTLLGFNRNINVPVSVEVHTAPRTLFAPLQAFNTDMYRFFGQITADPDFDLLRITAGTDFGLPSPGHTTLAQLPSSDWAVDSFFDITYRIDFIGAPGGSLAGRSGSTTGTIRMLTGGLPGCAGSCPKGYTCFRTLATNTDGSIRVCCNCVPECSCKGDMNSDGKLDGLDIQKFVTCLVDYLSGLVSFDCACADMNSDGMLTIPADVNLFVTKLLTDADGLCP